MSLSLLEAVNLCLRGAKFDEVANLELIDTDAKIAKSTVEHQAKFIQTQSWWFNTERNWKLTPDQNGHISVPSNAQSVVTSGYQYGIKDLTIRGNKLYDTYNHTFNMTDLLEDGTLTLTFIMNLDWDDIPPIARYFIAYTARAQFAQDSEIDLEVAKVHQMELEQAYDAFMKEDKRSKKTNIYTDNREVATKLSLIGGPNGRRYTSSVFPKRETY